MFKRIVLSTVLCISIQQNSTASSDPNVYDFHPLETTNIRIGQVNFQVLEEDIIQLKAYNAIPLAERTGPKPIFGDLKKKVTAQDVQLSLTFNPRNSYPTFSGENAFPGNSSAFLTVVQEKLDVNHENYGNIAYPEENSFGKNSEDIRDNTTAAHKLGIKRHTLKATPVELEASVIRAWSDLRAQTMRDLCNLNPNMMQLIANIKSNDVETVIGDANLRAGLNPSTVKEIFKFMNYAFGFNLAVNTTAGNSCELTIPGQPLSILASNIPRNTSDKRRMLYTSIDTILTSLQVYGWVFDTTDKVFKPDNQ